MNEDKAFATTNAERPFFLFLSINLPHDNNEAKEKAMEDAGVGPFAKQSWPDSEKGFPEKIRRLTSRQLCYAMRGELLSQKQTTGKRNSRCLLSAYTYLGIPDGFRATRKP